MFHTLFNTLWFCVPYSSDGKTRPSVIFYHLPHTGVTLKMNVTTTTSMTTSASTTDEPTLSPGMCSVLQFIMNAQDTILYWCISNHMSDIKMH